MKDEDVRYELANCPYDEIGLESIPGGGRVVALRQYDGTLRIALVIGRRTRNRDVIAAITRAMKIRKMIPSQLCGWEDRDIFMHKFSEMNYGHGLKRRASHAEIAGSRMKVLEARIRLHLERLETEGQFRGDHNVKSEKVFESLIDRKRAKTGDRIWYFFPYQNGELQAAERELRYWGHSSAKAKALCVYACEQALSGAAWLWPAGPDHPEEVPIDRDRVAHAIQAYRRRSKTP